MKIENSTLKKVLKKYREISLLSHIKATLDWDLNVNLPPLGSETRAIQSSYLSEMITNKWLDTKFRSLYEKAVTEKLTTVEEKAIIRNLGYGAKYYYNVPKDIIIEKDKTASEAFIIWRQAREENNYKKFLPSLTKLIDFDKTIARHLGYKDNPYDALLDLYEPELTAAECERLFNGLKKELVPLVKKITKSKDYSNTVSFVGASNHYPTPDQERIVHYIMQHMGFNSQAGRVDISAHPFTTELSRHDIRITTNYKETDFRESFTSTMHETGHALYEQGVNPDYDGTPLASGVSLGIHESLSRFWENMVGKNPIFLHSVSPIFKSFYQKQLHAVDEKSLIQSFNTVQPSLIRINADEVTYSLHIILRFEMENELINGNVQIKDAAEVWREKSKKLLGVASATDAEGILQDVHWAYGSFGYFPSYAMGNLYGAQFLATMKKKVDFDAVLAKGDLLLIKEWLDTNIHQYGSLYFPKELIKKVTGEKLDYTFFLNYLTEKYSRIYNLK